MQYTVDEMEAYLKMSGESKQKGDTITVENYGVTETWLKKGNLWVLQDDNL